VREAGERGLGLWTRYTCELCQIGTAERTLGDEQERLEERAEVVGHRHVIVSTTIGPNSSRWLTRTCRRRTSSSVASSVTVASVRDRQLASSCCSTTLPPSARAARSTVICIAIVISRATIS